MEMAGGRVKVCGRKRGHEGAGGLPAQVVVRSKGETRNFFKSTAKLAPIVS